MTGCMDYLKNCIENSVKQQGAKFAEDYAKYGFWGNPFAGHDYPLSSNYDLFFEDRKDEIESLSKDLVCSFLGRGEDVALVGAEGMGARSLINIFKHFIYTLETEEENQINTKIKENLFEVFDFKAKNITEDVLNQLKAKIELATKQKKTILLLSSFNEKVPLVKAEKKAHSQIPQIYRKLLELDRMSNDKTIFFSPWNATSFDFMLKEEYSAMDIYEKVIFLKPLSLTSSKNLIESRIKFFKNKSLPAVDLFNEESIQAIAEFSGGIPRYLLQFAHVVLESSIKSKRSKALNAKVVKSILNQEGYSSYADVLDSLTELIPSHPWETKHGKIRTEMKILKTAILMGKESTSTEIGRHVGKTRVAVLENLKKLEKAKIIEYVESSKDQRKRPFKLNDFAKSIFENEFIIPQIKKRIESQNE